MFSNTNDVVQSYNDKLLDSMTKKLRVIIKVKLTLNRSRQQIKRLL